MSDITQRVQQQFGSHAQAYVTSKDHAQGESLDRMLELLPLQPTWRALDLATGGGHTALALAPHVREVVASDITAPMLQAAEKFLQSKGITNATFREADACALPFGEAEFDVVTCRLAAHHFPDAIGFVRESARVLKPGGVLALIDNVTPPDTIAARHINAFEKLRDPSHVWEYATPDWKGFFIAAGLTVTHSEFFRKPLDFDAFCDRMSVPNHTREQLRVLLKYAPKTARASLTPEFYANGTITFYLGEVLLVGQKV